VAVGVAAGLPVIVLATLGALQFTTQLGDRSRLQAVADAAALAGAMELGVAKDRAVANGAEAFAEAQLARPGGSLAVVTRARVIDKGASLEVVLTGTRPSMLGALQPRGAQVRVRAVASSMGRTPRCLIGLDRSAGEAVAVADQARVLAPGCAVHSNSDLAVRDTGRLEARIVQAAGGASGAVDPAPVTGAEPIDDPFADRNIAVPRCPLVSGLVQVLDLRSGTRTLNAGVHCGDVFIRDSATLKLAKGEHYFLGDLTVGDRAALNGEDVTLFFDRGSRLIFDGAASVDLVGRQRGRNAGLLIVGARNNREDFSISSDNVRRLEGVVYMPASRLIVSGTGQVADRSEWTVTVTRALEVQGSPTLVINEDYAASDVPVPDDLGPGIGSARLSR
jgi:hypothetical protein